MKRLILCTALLAAGCSHSPTEPTPTVTQPGPGVSTTLRWDVLAPSCSQAAPNPLPDASTARLMTERDGAITASFPYSVAGRPVILYGHFVQTNGVWAMCSWDTADI